MATPITKSFSDTDIRVGVVGNVDAGKSTLIGVLTTGELDNGRGFAREKVFRHQHEASCGRTSSISYHIMGFDQENNAVHQPVAASAAASVKNKSWRNVVESSRSIVTFIDLAGHEKYLKTTIGGLSGCHPDYVMVLVAANNGVSRMTREHLGVAMALQIPLLVVVTKIDICPPNVLKHTLSTLFRLLKSQQGGKMPVLMRAESDISLCLGGGNLSSNPGKAKSKKSAVNTCGEVPGSNGAAEDPESSNSNKNNSSGSGSGSDNAHDKDTESSIGVGPMPARICPVFLVSSVKGTRIPLLQTFLSHMRAERTWVGESTEPAQLQIDESFVVAGVGIVVSGTVSAGVVRTGMHMQVGPFADGAFVPVLVRSIQSRRAPLDAAGPGVSCAVSLRSMHRKRPLKKPFLRRGLVLIERSSTPPHACRVFEAEIVVLHHPTTIKKNYQAVVHCGSIRQAAQIEEMDKRCLRTGDKATVRFRFMVRPEFLRVGGTLIFREGGCKGIGTVTRVYAK